jgi:uncharacterized membrane protein YgcG
MSRRPPFDAADEERIVLDMTRELELMTSATPVLPGEDFSDRIMAAIQDEPLPQPVRAFGLALVAGRLRAAAAAVADSWRVATSGFAPAAVRAQALALVVVVVVAGVALAGGATVGAINLLTPNGPVAPSPSPSPSPSVAPSPSPSPSPSDAPSPTTSPAPTDTAQPTGTDDHGGRTPRPTATGTDDHGGGPGSGGGGSGSGDGGSGGGSGSSGSGGGDHTPEPTTTDDHGGGGDG